MDPNSASGRLPPIDRSLRQQIRAEQLRMLLGHTTFVTVLATAFAVLLAQYAAHHVDPVSVHWWLAAKVLVALPRIAVAEWFKSTHAQPTQRMHRLSVLLVLIDGICWGMAGVLLMPLHDQQNATIIGACLMGVAAVASFTLHANWVANMAYCMPMVLPAALHLMSRKDSFGLFSGAALLVFVCGLMIVSRRAQRHVIEMLWRRFLMDRVVADKEEALRQSERQHAIKSQFVATMSHELRTPLHGILGLTRMLIDDIQQPEHLRHLGLVQRSGEHLLSIINHILDFSRIDAGHLQIDANPFDLDALLEDVVNLTTVTAQDKGLQLQGHIQLPKPHWVVGDAPRLRQVLLNLLGNAIKFTERGEVHLRAFRQGPNNTLVVQVQDSGIGIAPDDLRTIFDPYRQADNAVGRAMGGTGLGLTISREISRAMGGDITCRSTVGQGSTFEFSAQLATCPAPDSQQRSLRPRLLRAQDPMADASAELHGHVLLAEDNEVNAMIVEAQLRQHGLSVEHARDGAEALQRLTDAQRPRPDLVLMDCQMPRMDGFEATQRLRAHERTHAMPRLPVVALTASAMAEDSARCLSAGMDAHLSKPFEDMDLLRILSLYLNIDRERVLA
jgi:signal transduction histidine kinase/ActR/RegA family two-component response regulator